MHSSHDPNINTIPGNIEYSSIGSIVHNAVKNMDSISIKVNSNSIDNLVLINNLKIAINSIPIKMGNFTNLNGVKIQRKQLNQLSEFLLGNMRTPSILVSHCHIRTYRLLSYAF